MSCAVGEVTESTPLMPGPTVLVVEDENISRRALTHLLQQSGFRPAAFASAEAALREFDGGALPDVALVDVDLPGMSGLDLVDRLEQLHPGLMAVLITAVSGERIDRFRRAHDVHYIQKPLDFPRLVELLRCTPPSAERASRSTTDHTVV